MKISCYTDGSFRDGIPYYGGACIIFDGKHHIGTWKGASKKPEFLESRNIAGECIAVVQGLKTVMNKFPETTDITLYYDLEHVGKWCTGEYKAKKPVSKWMLQEIQTLLAQHPQLTITFKNIKGHSGVAGNELADDVAYEAVRYAKENGPFQTTSWLNI